MKKRYYVIAFILFLLVLGTGFLLCITVADVTIQPTYHQVEYGRRVSQDKSVYINEDSVSFTLSTDDITKQDIVNSVVCDFGELTVSDLPYQEVGKYTIECTVEEDDPLLFININKKKSEKITINIVDTTAPTFIEPVLELETYKDVSLDILELYTVEDLSSFATSVDETGIQYDVVGDYKATVWAEDSYHNKSSIEVAVKVKAPTIEVSRSSLSLYIGDTATISTEIHGKDQQAKFTSSDTSIATVNENGRVTAKGVGNCTITATANGVSANVSISVKEKKSSLFKTEGSVSQSAIDTGVAQLNLLPNNLYNHFKNNGWSYIIVGGTMRAGEHNVTNLSPGSAIYAVTYWDGTNKVYVNQNHLKSSLLHEFGHVIDYELGCTSCSAGFGDIYSAEKNAYLNVTGATKYTISTYREFFGDAFESYIKYPSQLKKHCPMTYEYINGIVAGL